MREGHPSLLVLRSFAVGRLPTRDRDEFDEIASVSSDERARLATRRILGTPARSAQLQGIERRQKIAPLRQTDCRSYRLSTFRTGRIHLWRPVRSPARCRFDRLVPSYCGALVSSADRPPHFAPRQAAAARNGLG